MTPRKYLLLLGVVLFGSLGDIALSRGMKNVGAVSLGNLSELIFAIFTPWVALGIVLLLAFMVSYMTALSWADLTYVLPATSFGYIVLALIAKFFLHETITPARWVGIALISLGVGFVTRGPASTYVLDEVAGTTHAVPEFPHTMAKRQTGDPR